METQESVADSFSLKHPLFIVEGLLYECVDSKKPIEMNGRGKSAKLAEFIGRGYPVLPASPCTPYRLQQKWAKRRKWHEFQPGAKPPR